MLLSATQLAELIRALDAARAASTGPGVGYYCSAPHVGPDGKTTRRVSKPKSRRPDGHQYPDGTVLHRTLEEPHPFIDVPLGVHGRGHLGIDPFTGQIGCALCAKGGA